jgi:flagellar biosynthetic protein FliR
MGILTRAVPSLNIFSIGIQLKLIVGFGVLILLSPVFGLFCDSLYSQMFTSIAGILRMATVS